MLHPNYYIEKAKVDKLISRKNVVSDIYNGIYERYEYPVLTREFAPVHWRYDLNPETNPYFMERLGINATLNSGAIYLNGKFYLVVRVEGNDRKSFFAVAESDTGIDGFHFWDYPVVLPKHMNGGTETEANVYAFAYEMSRRLNENQIVVVGNGSANVVCGHANIVKKGQRFISNSGIASMGYGLPASIGACVADHSQDIILITGDGSIQMNLQELETVVSHRMPIKIFIINNGGYHSIRQTQKNFFGEPLIGIGVDSGDLGFPSMEKLAWAYGFPYVAIHGNKELGEKVEETLAMDGPVICEVFVTLDQNFEPKSAAKRLPDGTLVSPPLEDLSPFLPDEEMDRIMLIPRIKK